SIVCWLLICNPCIFAQSLTATNAEPTSRITQTVSDDVRITLVGSRPRRAKDAYDSGAAPANLTMGRMLLLLKPTSLQTDQLAEYLREFQDPARANHHHWAPAGRFGAEYG